MLGSMSRTWLRGSTRPVWGQHRARPRPPSPPPPPLPLLQPHSSGLLLGPQPPGADARHHGDVLGCFGVGVFLLEAESERSKHSQQQHCDSASTAFLVPSCFCTSLLFPFLASSGSLLSVLSCLLLSAALSFLFAPCSWLSYYLY